MKDRLPAQPGTHIRAAQPQNDDPLDENYVRANISAFEGATIKSIKTAGNDLNIIFEDGREWIIAFEYLFDRNGMFMEIDT